MGSKAEPAHSGRQVRTMCRLCIASCGIVVHVEDDRVVRVTGDAEHPISQGYTCSKGRALPAFHHHPDRLDEPELHGVRASWDVVLGDLAGRLRVVIDRHGPDAVAAHRSFGWANDCNARYAIDHFVQTIGTSQSYSTTTLDLPNKHAVAHHMAGTNVLNALVDWERTTLLMLVGVNPVVSHGHTTGFANPVVSLRTLKARGGTVVVVDPRRTETAALADIHVPVRPGTDAALLAYLVREMLTTRPDDAYLDAVADLASRRRLAEAAAPYDATTTASICGVPESLLDRVREVFLRAPRFSFQTGTGISMSAGSNVAEWLGWALGAVTGSIDRPGGTLFNPGFLRPMEGGIAPRPRVTGPAPAARPELDHAFGEVPASALADQILAGNIRALLVVGANPVRVFPDSAKLTAALRGLEVLAVLDVRRTDTTALATHLLAVANQLERSDLPMFVDSTYPKPFTQYLPQVVPPGGQRRSAWRVLAELAERMGVRPAAPSSTDDDTLLARAASRARVPFEEIRHAACGVLADGAPDAGWLLPGALAQRLDLAPAVFVEQLAVWRRAVGEPSPLVLVNRRLPHQMNSMLQEVQTQQRPPLPTLLMHPDDAAARSLAPGAEVVIRSRHGETTGRVEVTAAVRTGTVSLPHAWGGPDVNRLTSDVDDVDPLTGMPRFSGFAVDVTVAGGGR
jgi:anaerobic selenocysteine-containing dehydrogenase